MICFGFGGQCTVVGVGAPVEPRVPGVAIGELVWHEAGAVELEPSRPCELPAQHPNCKSIRIHRLRVSELQVLGLYPEMGSKHDTVQACIMLKLE